MCADTHCELGIVGFHGGRRTGWEPSREPADACRLKGEKGFVTVDTREENRKRERGISKQTTLQPWAALACFELPDSLIPDVTSSLSRYPRPPLRRWESGLYFWAVLLTGFQRGRSECFTQSVFMKKNESAMKIQLLCLYTVACYLLHWLIWDSIGMPTVLMEFG